MLTQEQFSSLLAQIVALEFKKNESAFNEAKHDLVTSLYSGHADRILSEDESSTQSAVSGANESADFGMLDPATAQHSLELVASAVISSLTMAKIAAETFLAIQKILDYNAEKKAKVQDAQEQAHSLAVQQAELRAELRGRLKNHLPQKKAEAVAEQVVQVVIGQTLEKGR